MNLSSVVESYFEATVRRVDDRQMQTAPGLRRGLAVDPFNAHVLLSMMVVSSE